MKRATTKAIKELRAYKLRWQNKLRGFKKGSVSYLKARKRIREANYQIRLREKS